jgi:hypothetical protein
MAEHVCAGCGMDMDIASNPVERGGRQFCCPGCANETGCTC